LAFAFPLEVSRRNRLTAFVGALSIAILLGVLGSNLVGYWLREPGLKPRMKWGNQIAACLDRYQRENGRYPESLEALKKWGGSEVPPLYGGGVYGYERPSQQDGYELWLYLGFIEAYVLKGKDQDWAQYFCW